MERLRVLLPDVAVSWCSYIYHCGVRVQFVQQECLGFGCCGSAQLLECVPVPP